MLCLGQKSNRFGCIRSNNINLLKMSQTYHCNSNYNKFFLNKVRAVSSQVNKKQFSITICCLSSQYIIEILK
jgi:hypothetical protein